MRAAALLVALAATLLCVAGEQGVLSAAAGAPRPMSWPALDDAHCRAHAADADAASRAVLRGFMKPRRTALVTTSIMGTIKAGHNKLLAAQARLDIAQAAYDAAKTDPEKATAAQKVVDASQAALASQILQEQNMKDLMSAQINKLTQATSEAAKVKSAVRRSRVNPPRGYCTDAVHFVQAAEKLLKDAVNQLQAQLALPAGQVSEKSE